MPFELARALDNVVPAHARSVSTVSVDRSSTSVTGARDFEIDVTWDDYRQWVAGRLGSDWRASPREVTRAQFSKGTNTDFYSLTLERTATPQPYTVHAAVIGRPD